MHIFFSKRVLSYITVPFR